MRSELRPALVMLVLLSIVTGVAYPLAVTGIAHLVMPHAAGGSLIARGNGWVGSEWIGQTFTRPEYFWGRLSATSPFPGNASASAGSNFGPLNPALLDAARARIAALRAADPGAGALVPVDLVTASGSGLDPELSPAGVEYQVARVARARNLDREHVRALVREHTSGAWLGVLGESRVNVLELNLALDAESPAGPRSISADTTSISQRSTHRRRRRS
jgi:K+-transporting ATPase ATPase C chain